MNAVTGKGFNGPPPLKNQYNQYYINISINTMFSSQLL